MRTPPPHHDRIFDAVNRMLDMHKRLPDAKTRLEREIKYTDGQIDRLVYELFGLSDEEIRIVEGTAGEK